MQRPLRHFLSMVRGKTAPLVNVEDAARMLAVVEAVKLAAERGCAVQPEMI